MDRTDLLVRKDRLHETRLDTVQEPPLGEDEVRVRVDLLALTANNVTYGAFGDKLGYWQFFPAGTAAGEGWGRIPAWGFGTIVGTRHPDIPEGARLYGYFPMSTSVMLRPTQAQARGFGDGATHRASLHPLYNRYLYCRNDPFYRTETEGLQALLRPLLPTAWLIDDFLAQSNWFSSASRVDDRCVVFLSSASSKTACATAYLLAMRAGLQIVGLTSPANLAFCRSLGVYVTVLPYDHLDAVDAAAPCIYLDFAGNAALRASLHRRFTGLRYDCAIGGTHVDSLGTADGLPGPKATLFFAPAQAAKRAAELGGGEMRRQLQEGWEQYIDWIDSADPPRLTVRYHAGLEAGRIAYGSVLTGAADPRSGHVIRPAGETPLAD